MDENTIRLYVAKSRWALFQNEAPAAGMQEGKRRNHDTQSFTIAHGQALG